MVGGTVRRLARCRDGRVGWRAGPPWAVDKYTLGGRSFDVWTTDVHVQETDKSSVREEVLRRLVVAWGGGLVESQWMKTEGSSDSEAVLTHRASPGCSSSKF